MRISDVMTPNPRTVTPAETLQLAAQAMDELNVGVLPVCESGRLIGMLTDRDIVIRSISAGQDPRTATVADAMTASVQSLRKDAAIADAVKLMEAHQLRRLPVTDADGAVVGIVSLGDLADAGAPEATQVLGAISNPAEPER